MTELIKISRSEGGKDVVSAKELHLFLEVPSRFDMWFQRMAEYGFTENADYQRMHKIVQSGIRQNRQVLDDIAITLDMAKEISMIQRSEKGKQARQYFIEMEKRAKGVQVQQVPTNFKEALKLAYEQQIKIEELSQKAEYAEKVLQSKSTWVTTVIAKELGMSAIALNRKLKELGIQFKRDGVWVLTAKYQNKGYTDTRTHIYSDSKGDMCTAIETVWTEAGRNFVYQKINGVSISPNETLAQNCA